MSAFYRKSHRAYARVAAIFATAALLGSFVPLAAIPLTSLQTPTAQAFGGTEHLEMLASPAWAVVAVCWVAGLLASLFLPEPVLRASSALQVASLAAACAATLTVRASVTVEGLGLERLLWPGWVLLVGTLIGLIVTALALRASVLEVRAESRDAFD